MTLPVPVLRATSLLNTRRTHGGVLRLCPNPVVNRIIEFALAFAAKKHGIVLYAHISVSNHQHTALFDQFGNHPEFRRDFHSLTTRAVNRHRGEAEAMWSPDHKSPVILHDTEALLDHIAYIHANMCSHDLVERPEDWPGVRSLISDLAGPPKVIRRPEGFFDPTGEVPEWVLLQYQKPQAVAHWSDEEYRDDIARRVEAKCRAARESRRRRGVQVLGRAAILGQSHTDTSKSQPKLGTRNPRVACSLKALRIAFLLWLRRFRVSHRGARLAFEAGDRSCEFPFGTYLHERRYGVNCSSIGPPTVSVF